MPVSIICMYRNSSQWYMTGILWEGRGKEDFWETFPSSLKKKKKMTWKLVTAWISATTLINYLAVSTRAELCLSITQATHLSIWSPKGYDIHRCYVLTDLVWMQCKCLPTVKKYILWKLYVMKYYTWKLANEKYTPQYNTDESLNIMLNKKSWTQNNTYCMIQCI